MSRDFLLKIRVTPEEREAAWTAAAEAGLTVSDYVRLRLAHQRVRQTAAERDTRTDRAVATPRWITFCGWITPADRIRRRHFCAAMRI